MKLTNSLILLLIIFSFKLNAQTIIGNVFDENNNPLPFVNIHVKNTNIGTTTDFEGGFNFKLRSGTYNLVFTYVGYLMYEREVRVIANRTTQIEVKLKTANQELNEVLITADQRELAKAIMKNLRNKRKSFLDAVLNYETEYYRKSSLLKEFEVKESIDTIISDSSGTYNLKTENKKNQIKTEVLFETYNRVYFEAPSKFKEIVLAENDYSATPINNQFSLSYEFQPRGLNISNLYTDLQNQYILVHNAESADFNFFQNTIYLPHIGEKPFLSPLAISAPLNYNFDFEGMYYINNKKIFLINIKPIFKNDALFSGYIHVEDSTWLIHKIDFYFNPSATKFCSQLRIIQNYTHIDNKIVIPKSTELIYTIKEGKTTFWGDINIKYFNKLVNIEIPKSTFKNETKSYKEDALDKNTMFWDSIRPIQLNANERIFAHEIDSLKNLYSSYEYIKEKDSIFNDINFWSFIIRGIGIRNSFKRSELYILPLLAQTNPLGVGGYRHKLGGHYNKYFKNDFFLETDGFIDYGFLNKDVRGKLGVGLTYVPKRFIRTYLRFGDYYEMINDYASLASMFSRSNYVRAKTYSIAQRMEIINGLFGEVTFNFSNQTPITDMLIENWSHIIFGELNKPSDFEQYIKFEVALELKYKLNQKYIVKGNRKILLENNSPELSLLYRKGIPKIFKSEVDYDFLELGIKHNIKLARLGTSRGSFIVGSFINKNNLRIIEHKYFRGSDFLFFSNPMSSFQLLGPTLSSSSNYLRFNYLHSFDGAIFNKIPLISALKLSPIAGFGTLIMAENNFRHFEAFAGIQRMFRIRKQLFKLGLFAVTSDNTLNNPTLTYKIGISMYNPFTKKWDY